MIQFYLLSVVTLTAGGVALLLGNPSEGASRFRDLLADRRVRTGLGLAALLVGLVKLFVRSPYDATPVAGDLLPALAGMASGLALVAESYVAKTTESDQVAKVKGLVAAYRIPIGVVTLAAATLHFLFSGAAIL